MAEWGVSQGRVSNRRWTREKMLSRNCRVYIALYGWTCATGPETGRRIQLGSAQVSDGSGHAAQESDVDGERARGQKHHQDQGRAVFQQMAARGGPHDPPGAREMSADETKEGGQMQQCRARD